MLRPSVAPRADADQGAAETPETDRPARRGRRPVSQFGKGLSKSAQLERLYFALALWRLHPELWVRLVRGGAVLPAALDVPWLLDLFALNRRQVVATYTLLGKPIPDRDEPWLVQEFEPRWEDSELIDLRWKRHPRQRPRNRVGLTHQHRAEMLVRRLVDGWKLEAIADEYGLYRSHVLRDLRRLGARLFGPRVAIKATRPPSHAGRCLPHPVRHEEAPPHLQRTTGSQPRGIGRPPDGGPSPGRPRRPGRGAGAPHPSRTGPAGHPGAEDPLAPAREAGGRK